MKDSKIKRDFSTKVRQPFQDAIALIVYTIDYHNSFIGNKFHRRQARVLKWYLLDLKEWIREEEKKEMETENYKAIEHALFQPVSNYGELSDKPLEYKEELIGQGLYRRVPIQDCIECADREADLLLTGQTVSEQMQDELEPIIHPTQHDESDEIEEAKKSEGELTEFEKSEIKGKLRIENQEQVADYTDAYWKREFYNLDSTKEEVEWKIVKTEDGGFIRRPFPVKKTL